MKRTVLSMGLVASVLVLAGCSSGTTYGTSSTHEEATLKGLSKIFSIKSEKSTISYNNRPALVMPANNQILPAPVTQQAAVSNDQWPETPEQRIAKVRASAPEPEWRTGDLPVEYLQSEKEGINITSNNSSARQPVWAKENQLLEHISNDANGVSESKKARKLKDQIAYSTGVKRKFLTEPPTEYRQPAATAEVGDLGISEEELAARQKAEIDKNRSNPNSITVDGITY